MAGLPGSGGFDGFVARVRSLVRGLLRRSDVESEMRDEFRHHIELRTEDLVRGGLTWQEASRRARLEFGHAEMHLERSRASRGLDVFDGLRASWLDVKLGLRMLVKYPGLTLVAVLTLAAGIPVGLAPMHVSHAIEAPLPEDPDNRIRGLRYWDLAAADIETPTEHEYALWRDELQAFAMLGAYRPSAGNIAGDDGRAYPVAGAELTASTFAMLGTPPLLGRTLRPDDEVPGAPAVVVIGHDVWRSRLGADPGIIGRSLLVGASLRTVVGVMPESFRFPHRQQMWVPLVLQPGALPASSPDVRVLGRLADGVSPAEAQAELSAVHARVTALLAEGRDRFQAEVVPFGFSAIGMPRQGLAGLPGFYFFQLLALVLLLVACANVAMLVFARTATRYREMAVRTALGASRARIVSQIFVETAVLAVLSAGVGLFTINWALGRVQAAVLARGMDLPYWLTLEVTGRAMVWALVLAVLSAVVAGVAPALRVTGRRIQRNIQRAQAGRSGIRFGGVTGALVVVDVAISVIVLGFVLMFADRLRDATRTDALVGIPAQEFLAAEVRLPADAQRPVEQTSDGDAFRARLGIVQQRLMQRLADEPRVLSVTVASALPRMDHRARRIAVDGAAASDDDRGEWVRMAVVDVDFFATLERPVLAGRDFEPGDVAGGVPPVIINTVFAERLLDGRNPIGRRLRFVTPGEDSPSPWHEIVGVVGHLGINIVNPEGGPGFYVPAAAGAIHPMQLAIHVGDAPESFAPRLREIVAEVDATAMLGTPVVLSRVYQGDWYLLLAAGGGLVLLIVILVTLAASSLYAMISFSVSERTREIGIRAALGARQRTLVLTILRRSLMQVALGALLGLPLAARIVFEDPFGSGSPPVTALLVALAMAMGIIAVIGLFSCVVPARRALRIRPGDALRAER